MGDPFVSKAIVVIMLQNRVDAPQSPVKSPDGKVRVEHAVRVPCPAARRAHSTMCVHAAGGAPLRSFRRAACSTRTVFPAAFYLVSRRGRTKLSLLLCLSNPNAKLSNNAIRCPISSGCAIPPRT